MSRSLMGFVVQWMALSAAACLLEKTTQRPLGNLRVAPVSRAYFNKVIDGVESHASKRIVITDKFFEAWLGEQRRTLLRPDRASAAFDGDIGSK
jgi:hypothetical protein